MADAGQMVPNAPGQYNQVSLMDFSGGVRNSRANALSMPPNILWDGLNIDLQNKSLRTRLGMESCLGDPVLNDGVVEKLAQVRFPSTQSSYLIAQVRTTAECNLYASNTNLPSNDIEFTKIYELGVDAGKASIAVLNDRCIITEGIATVPLVFLGGMKEDGSDWVFPKQIICTFDGLNYFDMTTDLCDNDSETYTTIPALPAAGGIYMCFDVAEVSGLYLEVNTPNATNSVMKIEVYSGGEWSEVTITDNTSDQGVSLAKSGTVTWEVATADYYAIAEIPGYWFRMTFSLVAGSTHTIVSDIQSSSDYEQTNYLGTIVQWHKDSSHKGTFKNAGGNNVAVGDGTSVPIGTEVVFSDTTTAVISNITGDGTGTGGVTLSVDHATASLTGIYYGIFYGGSLTMSSYGGADGAANGSTDYATIQMTADYTAPLTAIASEEGIGQGWRAFDQTNEAGCFICDGTTGWLKIDLGSAKAVNKYLIQARNIIGQTGFPAAWTFDASNDNSNWTTLDTQTGIADPGQATWAPAFTFINDVAYRYYRLVISATTGTNAKLAIGELRLIECPKVHPLALAAGWCVGAEMDTTHWSWIDTVTVDQICPEGSNIYHSLSFDGRLTWKAYRSSTWRTIAEYDMGVWKYNSGTLLVAAPLNTEASALLSAFAVSANQWTASQIEGMIKADWITTGGFSQGETKLDWAWGMLEAGQTTGVTSLTISGQGLHGELYDIATSADLTIPDLKGLISYWNKGSTTTKGRFEGSQHTFDAQAVVDEGSGKVGFPSTAHGLSTGDKVRFYGCDTSAYNADFTVDATSTTDVIIVTVTYSAETLDSACHWRRIITLGSGKLNNDVEGGCLVVFGDGTLVLRSYSGDGTDPNVGVWLNTDHADGDITAIYGSFVGSGLFKLPSTTITDSAPADGADNPSTSYATQVMTSDTAPSPQVASSNGVLPYSAYKWFDQNTDTNGDHGASGNAYAQIDFGSGQAKVINKYDFFYGTISPSCHPKSWQLEGSNDGSNWTTLHSVSNYSECGNEVWVGQNGSNGGYFTCVNSTAYRYYKFTMTAVYKTPYYWDFKELKLVESLPSTTTYVPQKIQVATSAVGDQLDVSDWNHVQSATVTATTVGASNIYYGISFDNCTSYKAYVSGAWRGIVWDDSGTWKYNNSATATPNWVAASTNSAIGALQQAFGISYNRMTGPGMQAISQTNWEASGGFSVSVNTIDFAIGLYANGGTDVPYVDCIALTGLIDYSGDITLTQESDYDQPDYIKTVARWVPGTLTGAGQFQDSQNAPVAMDHTTYIGSIVEFADGARTISKIVGDGTDQNGINLSSDHAVGNVLSIKYLKWSADDGAVILNASGDADGSNNSSLISLTAAMTDDALPSPLVATSSSPFIGKAYLAFNQTATDAYDCWSTYEGTTAAWIKIDLSNSKKINKYYVKEANNTNGAFPKAWTFQGSANGTSWTTLDTQSNVSAPGQNTFAGPYTFSNDTAYRYYRLNVTDSNSTYLEIGELKLVENQPICCGGSLVSDVSVPASLPQTSLISSVALSAQAPGSSTISAIVSFDNGVVWKIYSSGWKDVVKLQAGQWKYNTNLSNPSWSNASPNTLLGALVNSFWMSRATMEGLTTEWNGASAWTTSSTEILFAYKMTGTGIYVPSVDKATVSCYIDPTYIVTKLSKMCFTGPTQSLCNIHESGTGDICMGFLLHNVNTNVVSDYTVNVADGSPVTGATMDGMTTAYKIYAGGVEPFFALTLSMANASNNSNASIMSGEYWNGTTWVSLPSFSDGTAITGKTLATKGELTWADIPQWRQCKPINYSQTMGYWIRLSFTAALSSPCMISEAAITSKPLPLVKHKFALSFSNRIALANRPDAMDQADISRQFEEYGFTGTSSISIRVGGQDEVLSVINSYDQMWLTKISDWYQITQDSFTTYTAPRGEAASQTPINSECIVMAPIDKYGKSVTGPIADAKNKQGVYFLNTNGAWCFTGAELYKLGEWVSWWDPTATAPRLDLEYLHLSSCVFYAFKNWLIWSVPMITEPNQVAQETCNRLIIYDITNGIWLPPADLSVVSLCQARMYRANSPGKVGEIALLAGGYDGYIYRLFSPVATDDNGTAISSYAESGWLPLANQGIEGLIRTATVLGWLDSGDLILSVFIDGEETVRPENIFTITSLSGQANFYAQDFSPRNIQGRYFKFSLAWTGQGEIYGMEVEVAPLRSWPSTA